MKRFLSLSLAALLLTIGLQIEAEGVQKPKSTPPKKPAHLLVRFKPLAASRIEKSLSADSALIAQSATDPGLKRFLQLYKIKRMVPLHQDLVNQKRRTGKSVRELALETRNQFPTRAKRFRGLYAPKDLSTTYVVELQNDSESELAQQLAALQRDTYIESAQMEQTYQAQLVPNDPYYSSSNSWGQGSADLYGLKKMQLGSAWDITAGLGVIVAVVDSGIDYTHPDLAANVWTNGADGSHGFNVLNNTTNVMDDNGHGTHVAGTIAATGQNNLGVIGVAWKAKVMGIKGLDSAGNGFTSGLAQGIRWATDHGAQVINMSWGGEGAIDPVLADALQYAYSNGVVLVAAAGNNSINVEHFSPANSTLVIAVSATDASDVFANFSNFGNKIDVSAPGVGILSLQSSGTALGPVVSPGYIYLNGTSMSAPHVAGLAALILAQHPAYTNEQVRAVLRVTADDIGAPGFDMLYGSGRINALKALQQPTVPQASSPTVTIITPVNGANLKGIVTVSGTASDSIGISKVVIEADGELIGLATGTSGWTFALDSTLILNGSHALTARVYNEADLQTTVSINVNVQNTGMAVYNSTLKAPVCASVDSVCYSSTLTGRAQIIGGPEANQPNTLQNSCDDGPTGIFHSDESNDRIKISTLDGSPLAAGKQVKFEAMVWAYTLFGMDSLDYYYATNASSPTWVLLGTVHPSMPGGQTLSTTFTLAAGANLQAVRAGFRFSGATPGACTTGSFDDHDDLVFQLSSQDTTPPSVPTGVQLIAATQTTLVFNWQPSTDNVGVKGYRIDASTTAQFTVSLASYTNRDVGFVTSFTLNNLTAGTTYYARVRAYDAANNVSTHSAVAVGRTALPDPGTAFFVKSDDTTKGNWPTVYGGDGQIIKCDNDRRDPNYTQTHILDAVPVEWAAGTTDPRGLLHGDGTTGRSACAWSYPNEFFADITMFTGPRQIAIYMVDWDNAGRTQIVQLVDTRGNILDSRTVTNFSGGRYLVWSVTGHVYIKIVNTNNQSFSVVSGLFFGGSGPLGGGTPPQQPANLPAPMFNPPAELTMTDTLTASYDPTIPVQSFTWTLTLSESKTLNPNAATVKTVTSRAVGSSGELSLNSVNAQAGKYQVSVAAVTTDGAVSPEAMANVTLINAASALSPRVFPSPWRAPRDVGSNVTFDGIPAGSSVKIFTIAGHYVATLSAPSGVASWDLRTSAGDDVASGVYFYLVTDPQGHKTRGKIGIIR